MTGEKIHQYVLIYITIFFISALAYSVYRVTQTLAEGQSKLQEILSDISTSQMRIVETQKEIVEMAERTGQERALASLIVELGNTEDRGRRIAVRALAEFGEYSKIVISPLLMTLEDDDEEVRSAAVEALVEIYNQHTPPTLVQKIINLFDEKENENVIEGSVLILDRIGKTEELITILESAKPYTFELAIDAIKNEKNLSFLKEILKSQNLSDIKTIYVIKTIGIIGFDMGKPVVQYLAELIKKRDLEENTRVAVVNTLDNIMKQRLDDDDSVSLIKKTLFDLMEKDSDRVRAAAVSAMEMFCCEPDIRGALHLIASQQNKTKSISKKVAQLVLENKKCNKIKNIKDNFQ